MKRNSTLVMAAAALFVVSGCASGSQSAGGSAIASSAPTAAGECTPAPATATTENPYGDSKVDPPAAGEPILTTTSKAGTETGFTLTELEALGTRTLNISEPFVKTCQTFTAVPLKAILEKAGISTTGGSLDTVALNAYSYTGVIADMVNSDALIATRLDGAEIPIDRGGPVRLIFADGTPMSTNLDAWNWSLASLREK